MEKKKITIRLQPTTHKQFKMHCVEHGTSAQEVIEQYILVLLDTRMDPQEAIKSLKEDD
jgi:hypothetical protein